MVKKGNDSSNDDFLLIMFYFIPILFNYQVLRFMNNETRIKGVILVGVAHYVISTFILIIVILLFNKAIDILFKINNNIKRKRDILKYMAISPFMLFWIITLLFELFGNYVRQYVGGNYIYILIFLYSLTFVFQLLFVKKIENIK